MLGLLAERHHDLSALRTQAACRRHVVLRELIAGGAPLRLSADRAARLLRGVRPNTAVEVERKAIAHDLLVDIRGLDRDITAVKTRIQAAVAVSGTTLVELNGVGPIVAAIVLGQVADPQRFPTRDRFAAYNRTAPLEASSGPPVRHRLNPRGNHPAQPRAAPDRGHPDRARHTGRAYYDRKITQGKSKKEALRALKRRLSDAVWRQLRTDLDQH